MCTNELCNTLILNHTRYFVHAEFQIVIKMNYIQDESVTNSSSSAVLAKPFQNENNETKFDDLNIYTWSTCRKCQKVVKLKI